MAIMEVHETFNRAGINAVMKACGIDTTQVPYFFLPTNNMLMAYQELLLQTTTLIYNFLGMVHVVYVAAAVHLVSDEY